MKKQPTYTTLPLEVKNQDGRMIAITSADSLLKGFSGYQSKDDSNNISLNHFAGENFSIWYSKYNMKDATILKARSDLPTLELHIPLDKPFISKWDGYFEDLHAERQYDISFTPFVKSESQFQKGVNYTTYDVHYDRNFLGRYSHIKQISNFLNKVEKNQPASLLEETRFLTPSMMHTINNALSHTIDPSLLSLYYESSSIMLFTLLLNQIITPKLRPFSSFERECAMHVKELISKDITQTHSIADLCRVTGINEMKLQDCFRELFGTTIFHYLLSIRMEHACRLLLDTNLPIRMIAFHCGYTENSNFTTTFKNNFGCTPDAFRKKS